uniref:PH domain-containing protein n=1 Tax=Globisporangium ultimum (strain ATCC 200006 / CBS 805.95 / DAOM BR144) TaxID=431595 RepID=K3X3Z1_GLOUD
MKLSSDEQSLLWRVHESQKQLTRIDLHDVNLIETSGAQGFSIVSQKGETLLDLEAENEEVRNNWVTNLQLLCEDSGDIDDAAGAAVSSDVASKFRKMVEDKAKKQAYWAKRTQELEDRKRNAEERKKQFSGAGLKYTAIAMTNRP